MPRAAHFVLDAARSHRCHWQRSMGSRIEQPISLDMTKMFLDSGLGRYKQMRGSTWCVRAAQDLEYWSTAIVR
jgi:hypothetical protein